MEKKSKILLLFASTAIVVTIASCVYKFGILNDYVVVAEVYCEPDIEDCFISACNPEIEICDSDQKNYKFLFIHAATNVTCDIFEQECYSSICEEPEANCDFEYCLNEYEACS